MQARGPQDEPCLLPIVSIQPVTRAVVEMAAAEKVGKVAETETAAAEKAGTAGGQEMVVESSQR